MTDGIGGEAGSRSEQRWLWTALVASCVIYVVLALFHLFVQKPYTNGDEKRHVQYVAVLETKHRLPKMRETRAASHPPAYYALQAATVLDGIKSADDAESKIGKAALISIAFGLVAVIYSGLTLALLFRRYPGFAVFAMALVALLPTLHNNSAAVNNDAMALAAQLGMGYAALTVLYRGPTALRLGHAMVWMCIGALTRVTVVALLPVAMLAMFAGGILHGKGSAQRRVLLSVARGAVLVAAVAAAAGWFYLRNEKQLGSASGTEAILEDTRNHPIRPFLDVLFDYTTWVEIQDELWGRFAGGVSIEGGLRKLARVLVVVSILGAAVSLVRAKAWRAIAAWRTPEGIAWLLMAATWASVFVPTIYYHAKGGGLHQRYLFGALPVMTLVLALGVGWTARRTVALASFALFYFLAFAETLSYATARGKRSEEFTLAIAMDNNRLSHEQAAWFSVLMLVVLAVGLVLLLQALHHLHRPLAAWGLATAGPAVDAAARASTVAAPASLLRPTVPAAPIDVEPVPGEPAPLPARPPPGPPPPDGVVVEASGDAAPAATASIVPATIKDAVPPTIREELPLPPAEEVTGPAKKGVPGTVYETGAGKTSEDPPPEAPSPKEAEQEDDAKQDEPKT